MSSNLAQSIRELTGLAEVTGRRKYHDLYAEELASQVERDKEQMDNLSATIKTANGAIQLALQQMGQMAKQHEILVREFAEVQKQLKALPQPAEKSDKEGGKGE